MMNKVLIRHYMAFAAAAACVFTSVHAQTYPAKPITILVGTGAGGNPDTIARVFQSYVAKKNQTVIVESRTGAGGAIALRATAQAPADGYTLMSGASATHGFFVKEPGYKFEDLVPVSVVGMSTYGLLVGNSTNFKTVKDLVNYGKGNPGKLNFGIIPGTSHEIEVDNLMKLLGVNAVKIAYKGMPEVYRALMAGEIHASIHSNSPQVKQGQVRALAFGGKTRLPDAPDVPTFTESGYDYHPGVGFIFYARAGTPRDRLLKISGEVSDFVKTPEFAELVTKNLGITGLGLSLEESAKFSKDEYERVKAGAQRLGIKPQ